MTALDNAIRELEAALEQVQAIAADDVLHLWQILATDLGDGEPVDPQAIIAALQEHLPGVVTGWAGIVADDTATWYRELAPEEKFTATVPPDLIAPERIAASISWAVNTATTAQTAIAQLQGSVHRAIADAQRETVAYNASREQVRYRRHCGYSACTWCLVMAGRGAVYKSSKSAVRGHDSCRCLAVPERRGMTDYTVPPLVREAEAKYADAARALSAEGVASPSLQAIIAKMDALAAAT